MLIIVSFIKGTGLLRLLNFKMFKSRKYVFILISLLVCFPLNFHGQPLRNRNITQLNLTKGSHDKDTMSSSANNNDFLKRNVETSYISVTTSFMALSICLLVVGTFFSSLIIRYLSSVPLAKHSIILYLHKDIAISSLIICYINSLSIMDCYLNGNGTSVNDWHAKVISYCLVQSFLYVLCTLNVIMLMKLYAQKENVLDPAMPWEMSDETVIKIWRGAYFVLMNIIMITTYLLEHYPLLYYTIKGDSRMSSELPIGSKIFPLAFLVLFILSMVLGIISKIYRNQDIRTFSTTSASLAILGDLVFIPSLFISSLAICIILVLHDIIGNYIFWIQCILSQTTIGIIAPLMTIGRSTNLQCYVINEAKQLRTRLSNFWNRIKPRSSRIYTID